MKLLSTLILSFIFLASQLNTVQAHAGHMMDLDNSHEATSSTHPELELETMVNNLLSQQNVDSPQQLNCSQISDQDLQNLGDALMETQHPGEEHEIMDEMMGGEGSTSLQQMHLNMGLSYLGCDSEYAPVIGRFNNNNLYPQGRRGRANTMMGSGYDNNSGQLYFILITWLALNSFLISGTYFFIQNSRSSK